MKHPRSAYLHIPFCHRRCFYCDFSIVPLGQKALKGSQNYDDLIKSYLQLLHREISLSPDGPPLSTVYIGGGTPSLLSGPDISQLLEHLLKRYGLQDGAEITLEVDPSTFSKADLNNFLEAGINRLSLGGQSFDDEVLKKIGRIHSSEQLIESCKWLDEAFNNDQLISWSLDLIQNLPDQTFSTWEDQLRKAINTSAPHLSIYDLSIEPGTLFHNKYKKGELNLPDDDLSADINLCTNAMLLEAGFSRYEISNFALPGHASRHNRMYWSGSYWWGFGMGATSFNYGTRFSRPKTIKSYENWLNKEEKKEKKSSIGFSNLVTTSFDELLMIGLRRREGVNINEIAQICGWEDDAYRKNIDSLMIYWKDFIDSGLLIRCGERIFLSNPEGMNISNHILTQMIIWWESIHDFSVDQSNF